MKKNLTFIVLIFVAACSPQPVPGLPDFPLSKGTTWVYSYEAYEPALSDPTQIVKATYQLTETVIETETISSYFVAHVERKYQLVDAEADWMGDLFSNGPSEFWYIVQGNQIFQSNLPIDTNAIKTDELILDYEFPLSVSKAWCLQSPNFQGPKKMTSCETVGKRMVTNQSAYETPADKFDDCYELTDYFNTGNIFQKFCAGVGIVSMKFDHAGTKFGFGQSLIQYSLGTP